MKLSNRRLKQIPNATFLKLAIPLLILFQITLPGIVLCFGTDGHIALEKSNTGSCCEYISNSDFNSYPFLRTGNDSETGHCGSCIDVRISDDNSKNKLISSNDLMPEIDVSGTAAYVLSSQWSQENSNQRSIIQKLTTGNALFYTLRTTILIC